MLEVLVHESFVFGVSFAGNAACFKDIGLL